MTSGAIRLLKRGIRISCIASRNANANRSAYDDCTPSAAFGNSLATATPAPTNNRETATINFFIKAALKLEIKQDPLLAKTTGLAEEDSDETRIASLPESTKDGFWWGWCSLSLE